MMSLVISPLLRRNAVGFDGIMRRLVRISIDAPLDLRPEMPDQPLDRPRRRVAKRADRVSLDLRRDFEQHVDLTLMRAALGHAAHDPPHPARALAAGRAPAAALV